MLPELPMMGGHVGCWAQHHDLPTLCSQHQTADRILLQKGHATISFSCIPNCFPDGRVTWS